MKSISFNCPDSLADFVEAEVRYHHISTEQLIIQALNHFQTKVREDNAAAVGRLDEQEEW